MQTYIAKGKGFGRRPKYEDACGNDIPASDAEEMKHNEEIAKSREKIKALFGA